MRKLEHIKCKIEKSGASHVPMGEFCAPEKKIKRKARLMKKFYTILVWTCYGESVMRR